MLYLFSTLFVNLRPVWFLLQTLVPSLSTHPVCADFLRQEGGLGWEWRWVGGSPPRRWDADIITPDGLCACFGILSSVLCPVHCIQLGKLFSSSGFFPPDYVKPWKLLQQTQAHCSLLCCVYRSQTHFPASCQKKEGGDAFGVPTPQMRVLGRVPG